MLPSLKSTRMQYLQDIMSGRKNALMQRMFQQRRFLVGRNWAWRSATQKLSKICLTWRNTYPIPGVKISGCLSETSSGKQCMPCIPKRRNNIFMMLRLREGRQKTTYRTRSTQCVSKRSSLMSCSSMTTSPRRKGEDWAVCSYQRLARVSPIRRGRWMGAKHRSWMTRSIPRSKGSKMKMRKVSMHKIKVSSTGLWAWHQWTSSVITRRTRIWSQLPKVMSQITIKFCIHLVFLSHSSKMTLTIVIPIWTKMATTMGKTSSKIAIKEKMIWMGND